MICFLFLSPNSDGPENINLKLSPTQKYYEEGSNIILSCSADSRPAAHFNWFLNADLLSDTGPELRLMNIQESQSGNYSCRALNNKTDRYETSQLSVVFVLGKFEYKVLYKEMWILLTGFGDVLVIVSGKTFLNIKKDVLTFVAQTETVQTFVCTQDQ